MNGYYSLFCWRFFGIKKTFVILGGYNQNNCKVFLLTRSIIAGEGWLKNEHKKSLPFFKKK